MSYAIMMPQMTYTDWCKVKGVAHAHCPLECYHPQPFVHEGALYCGRCWFKENTLTLMTPCTPEACEDGH